MPLHHLKLFFCFNSSVKLAAFESDPVTQVQSSYFDLQIAQDALGLAAYKNSGFLPGILPVFLYGTTGVLFALFRYVQVGDGAFGHLCGEVEGLR